MSLRFALKLNRLLTAVAVVVWLPCFAVNGGQLRVATWDLQPKDGASTTEAAAVLKGLNADVILLQGIKDRQSCEELAKALAPAEYYVSVCSTFDEAQAGGSNRSQVAILAKGQAAVSSFETWRKESQSSAPGGFAYAAFRLEERTIGFFSVQLNDGTTAANWDSAESQAAREEAARQLVRQIDALGDAAAKVQAVVVGGDFSTTLDDARLSRELTLVRLERAGFSNVMAGFPPEKRVTRPHNDARPDATLDYIFVRDAGRVANVQIIPGAGMEHQLVACELNWNPPIVAQAGGANQTRAESGAANPAPSLGSLWRTFMAQIGAENVLWLAGLLAGGVILVVAGSWMMAQRRGGTGPRSAPIAPGDLGPASAGSPPGAGEMVIVTRSTQTGSSAPQGTMAAAPAVVRIEAPINTQALERRAEEAERRAERATAMVRAGLMPSLSRWLRERFVQRLASDRQQLLAAQQEAALKMEAVDQRLTKVELQIQQRNREYEKRIEALQRELATAKEENRELIRAKIAQVRAEMERERTRAMLHVQEMG